MDRVAQDKGMLGLRNFVNGRIVGWYKVLTEASGGTLRRSGALGQARLE